MVEASTSRDPGWGFAVASVAAAGAAAAFFALAPVVAIMEESSQTTVGESTSGGMASPAPPTDTRTQETRTLAEAQGWGSVAFVAVPPLMVSALPLLAPRGRPAKVLRTVATALLFGWVLLGALSVGIFYLPSAGLMLVATILAYTRS
jgi:hypothetical protein